MKKLSICLFISVFISNVYGQDITNSLGTSGTFLLENAGAAPIIKARASNNSATAQPYVQIGEASSTPHVQNRELSIVREGGTAGIELYSFLSTGFSSFNKIELFHSRGTNQTKAAVHHDDELGRFAWYGTGSSNTYTIPSAYIGIDCKSYMGSSESGAVSTTIPPSSYEFNATNALGTVRAIMDVNGDGSAQLRHGSLLEPVTTISSATTLDISYHTVLAGGTTYTITLPSAASARSGKTYKIKKTSSSGVLTIDGDGSETIDGSLTHIIYTQYDFIEIICDGSNWHIIDQKNSAVRSTTSTVTVTASDQTILADVSGGAISVNLPTAASVRGKVYMIKKTSTGSNSVTIDPAGSEQIAGTTVLVFNGNKGARQIISDGTAWWVISTN